MAAKKKNTSSGEFPSPLDLPATALCLRVDPASLGFGTTDELPDLESIIGQPRAMRALELAIEVDGPGYNIFLLGLPGSGKTTLSQEYLLRKAAGQPCPNDWCYVNNFKNMIAPRTLCLPAGQATELRTKMQELISYCEREIPRAFESKEYEEERDRLIETLKNQEETEFHHLQEHAAKFNFIIARTPFGVVLVPAVQGKPLEPEDVEKLSQEQRAKLEQIQAKLTEEVEDTLKRMRALTNAAAEKMTELNKKTARFVITHEVESLRQKFASLPAVRDYLNDVEDDIIQYAGQFLKSESQDQSSSGSWQSSIAEWKKRYDINILVDHAASQGAPVVVETHPVYHNLIGRIEHEVIMGATRTDFTMIRPGAFHRANGGYLILPARDLLINPYAWEGVKRVLRDGCIRIIDLGSQLGLLSTETLEPEPIPLEIKVLLVGTPLLYYLLQAYDEDFPKLFKVRAEFASTMDRTPAAEQEYGLFVKSVVLDNRLPAFDNTAVARIIEHSARLAENQHKLSTRFGQIADLVREAAFWAQKRAAAAPEAAVAQAGAPQSETISTVKPVSAEDVQRAIDEAIFRNSLLDERIQELIVENTLMVDVQGQAVGQINALSVYSLGEFMFGRPSRLTASVSAGRAGVVDIERQAQLGGSFHTKGVLLLSGFINGRFGQHKPVNLTASLAFEQSYSEIDGDSASAAELLALLSAIAGVPLRQDIAITGSVNQLGQIQAIGGVNEKIEGFFATCMAKGFTGAQGVLVPRANLRNLMLKDSVVQAVVEKRFFIHAFDHIDQGIALFTGLPAGQAQAQGDYPEGTFNALVSKRLDEFNRILERTANQKDASREVRDELE